MEHGEGRKGKSQGGKSKEEEKLQVYSDLKFQKSKQELELFNKSLGLVLTPYFKS